MMKIGMFSVVLALLAGGMASMGASVAQACGGYGDTAQVRPQTIEEGLRELFRSQGRVLTDVTVLRSQAATERRAGVVFVRAHFRTEEGSFSQRLALTSVASGGVFASIWTVVPRLRGPVRAVRVG